MLNPEKASGLHMEPPKNPPEPLRTCVQKALDNYFTDLNGHAPGDLYQMVMREVEAPLLESVMAYTRGNQTRAAEILGINRSTLRKRLRTHNLDK